MNDPDTIRILVTTDNHVGYNEKDPVRGSDSAATFDEIMWIAAEQQVDLVLQGGDLFHYNKPSRQSMYNVIKTLRKTCLGDKPVQLETLNHGTFDMDDEELDHVNYEDPNLNVAIPMFAISGNHDDAGGQAMLSAMDVLAATGLVNHFGRVPDLRDIVVEPVLLRKGKTKLALYGMASVREERLKRSFRDGCVTFKRPPNADQEWYSLLAVHQNHTAHGKSDNNLKEEVLPKFLDTVIWGHEHECLIDPRANDHGTNIIQPGSSVATSLCDGEAARKHIGLITLKGRHAKFEKIALKTVRPFKMERVVLKEEHEVKEFSGNEHKGKVTQWMMKKVDAMIDAARQEWVTQQSGYSDDHVQEEDDAVPLPLVRLHVDYTGGFEVENPTRFSNRFRGRVANDNDIVVYARQRQFLRKRQEDDIEEEQTEVVSEEPVMDEALVHQLAEEMLGEKKLEVLYEESLGGAVREFVQDTTSKGTVKDFVDDALARQMQNLLTTGIAGDDKQAMLDAMMAAKSQQSEYKPKPKAEKEETPKPAKATATTTSTRGRGRGGGRARASGGGGTRGRGGARGGGATAASRKTKDKDDEKSSDSEVVIESDDDDGDVEMEDEAASTPASSSTRTRAKRQSAPAPAPAQAAAKPKTTKTKAPSRAQTTKTSASKAASKKTAAAAATPAPRKAIEIGSGDDDEDDDDSDGFV